MLCIGRMVCDIELFYRCLFLGKAKNINNENFFWIQHNIRTDPGEGTKKENTTR